jgi:hypothetical protein
LQPISRLSKANSRSWFAATTWKYGSLTTDFGMRGQGV